MIPNTKIIKSLTFLQQYFIFSRTTFYEVFSTLFWSIFGAILLSFFILAILAFKLPKEEKTIGFDSILYMIFFSVLAKEIPINPQKVPAKIFFLTLCLCGSLIFYSYNAGLVSLLAVEIFWYPIESIEVFILDLERSDCSNVYEYDPYWLNYWHTSCNKGTSSFTSNTLLIR